MGSKRTKEYKKDENLESLLKEINGFLNPVEDKILENFKKLEYPVILIMGCARSGTTLLLQWLAELGHFAYPTNILSRFYEAPYIGAKIQLMLTKYDYNNEIFDFNEKVPFKSNLGKTKGALAPNEFWYFWRRFFKFDEVHKLEDNELEKINTEKFRSELAALESVFGKPLAMKAMIVNWHIPFIADILDNVLFIHIKRKPFYNMQSLLQSREKFYGDKNEWYSFKPPEYDSLKDLSAYEQVAGQLYYTNQEIEESLQEISENKYMSIKYEEFCNSPKDIFNMIVEKFSSQNTRIEDKYDGLDNFQPRNNVRLDEDETKKIIEAYESVSGCKIYL